MLRQWQNTYNDCYLAQYTHLLFVYATAATDHKVQEEACLALCRLGMVEENALRIVAEGGIAAVLFAMKQHIDHAGVQVRHIS
jgi:hypothetical protein